MSVTIKLARVDSRLLHATVALNWNQFIDADTVLVVDPQYIEDPFIANVMQLCLPKTMKVHFFSVERFLAYLQEEHNEKAMIIFRDLRIAKEAVQAGFWTGEIQLPYPASRMVIKRLSDYFKEDEINSIRLIQDNGIRLYFQTSPFDNKDYSAFYKGDK